MAPRKRSRRLRPKVPARIRKMKKRRRARGRQHPELVGLGLLSLGFFLAVIVWLDWDGGVIGGKVDEWLAALLGDGRMGVPLILVGLGALMVGRASLVDLSPFRTGSIVLSIGAMTLVGTEGGAIGRLLGETGTSILALFLLAAGALLVTGASIGALIQHSAHAARETAAAERRSAERIRLAAADTSWALSPGHVSESQGPPIDGEEAFPDVVSETPPPSPILLDQLEDVDEEIDEEPEVREPDLFGPVSTEH